MLSGVSHVPRVGSHLSPVHGTDSQPVKPCTPPPPVTMPYVAGAGYTSSVKAKFCKSLFISHKFNKRRLESQLHALWQEITNDLTSSFDNLVPHVQHSMHIQWGDNGLVLRKGRTHGLLADGVDVEEGSDGAITDEDDYDNYDEEVNTSISSDTTVPGVAWDFLPDLVVQHVRFHELPNDDPLHRSHGGIKIRHACPCLISEFKRGPSRSLNAQDNTTQIPMQVMPHHVYL